MYKYLRGFNLDTLCHSNARGLNYSIECLSDRTWLTFQKIDIHGKTKQCFQDDERTRLGGYQVSLLA